MPAPKDQEQYCGKTNCNIHPHHISPVKELIENGDYDKIYDINNGITVCVPCHRIKHTQGGGLKLEQ